MPWMLIEASKSKIYHELSNCHHCPGTDAELAQHQEAHFCQPSRLCIAREMVKCLHESPMERKVACDHATATIKAVVRQSLVRQLWKFFMVRWDLWLCPSLGLEWRSRWRVFGTHAKIISCRCWIDQNWPICFAHKPLHSLGWGSSAWMMICSSWRWTDVTQCHNMATSRTPQSARTKQKMNMHAASLYYIDFEKMDMDSNCTTTQGDDTWIIYSLLIYIYIIIYIHTYNHIYSIYIHNHIYIYYLYSSMLFC